MTRLGAPGERSRKHVWISNTAFSRMTGIRKVCMVCGQPSNNADRECPGKRPEAAMSLKAIFERIGNS